jgi:hypothetical protein
MDIKVSLNTRRIVILSAAFTVFGLSVFLIGMVVGTKARPPEVPSKVAQAKAAGADLADKIPQKIPELEKPTVESAVASLPDSLGKDKLVVPEIDIKKEVTDKLPDADAKKEALDKVAESEASAKKAVADKLTVPEVDVKKEVAALVPPVLKDKAVPKTADSAVPNPAEKDKKPAGKPDAGKAGDVKPPAGEAKADAKTPVVDKKLNEVKSSGAFTVQVGDFLEKSNAEVMLQDLRDKRYTPYIHTIWDDMKRQWHTVRLGNYEDHEAASKAAADFTKKERLPTRVRGVGVL